MDSDQDLINQNTDNVISHYWDKFIPFWPIFLLLVIISTACAWAFTNYKMPLYESSATILIKDEKRGFEDSKMIESLNPLSEKKTIENEIEIIKSRALMYQVVKELMLYAPIFKKGKFYDIAAYDLTPIKISVQNIDSLKEINNIYFTYDGKSGFIKINNQNYPVDTWIETPWGKLKFSPTNIVTNDNYYFSLINPQRIVQQLINKLDVTSGKISSVINLKIKDEVPKRSADILNTLITVYEKAAVTDKNMLAKNTLSFLDERLKYVSNYLDSIEQKLQQYKAKKGAIDISSQGKIFLQNVSDNDQKLSDLNMKLAILKQVQDFVQSNNNQGGFVPSTLGIDDPLLNNLLNKLYDAELQYEKFKNTTAENNPQLISLADQIVKIKPSILENIQSQERSLQAGKRNLYKTNSSYTSLLQALPQQERDLVEISREQNIKSSLYSFLLQKREETALSLSSTVSDTRVVDKAQASLDPAGLSQSIIYLVAIFLALALGIAIITSMELFNSTILFRKEIETLTSFPVIGEIALEKSKSPIVIEDGNDNFIAEEFRLLRTSLHSFGGATKNKKILITSTISGEGKSFVAVNLAITLALSGKKVVLLEFDLKNPTLALKLNMNNAKGVADYLLDIAETDEIIRETAHKNLYLISAGNLPRNPSELILRERTSDLLHYLKNNFDYVLVDSAPVGILSDGYVLSRHCDATIYVVRHGHTPKRMLEKLDLNNKINSLKNLVIVFNGVRERGFGRYSYGYGYIHHQHLKKTKKIFNI